MQHKSFYNLCNNNKKKPCKHPLFTHLCKSANGTTTKDNNNKKRLKLAPFLKDICSCSTTICRKVTFFLRLYLKKVKGLKVWKEHVYRCICSLLMVNHFKSASPRTFWLLPQLSGILCRWCHRAAGVRGQHDVFLWRREPGTDVHHRGESAQGVHQAPDVNLPLAVFISKLSFNFCSALVLHLKPEGLYHRLTLWHIF